MTALSAVFDTSAPVLVTGAKRLAVCEMFRQLVDAGTVKQE